MREYVKAILEHNEFEESGKNALEQFLFELELEIKTRGGNLCEIHFPEFFENNPTLKVADNSFHKPNTEDVFSEAEKQKT